MVPMSSDDSSGLVPIKSKLRQRTVRERARSPRLTSCLGSAAVIKDECTLLCDDLECIGFLSDPKKWNRNKF